MCCQTRYLLLITVRRIPLALIAALTVLGGTGVAGAQSSPATGDAVFSFADPTTLATSCAALVKGVEVEVRNDTASPQTLRVLLGPLSDGSGASSRPADVCGGLSVKISKAAAIAADGQRAIVGPGASATVSLSGIQVPPASAASGGSVPAQASTWMTTLVVFAGRGLVSRRDVVVREVAGAGVDAVPLVDSRSVTHERYDPADDWQIWMPVKLAPGQTPSLGAGQTVGVLTGPGGTTAVTYEGGAPRKLTGTFSLLPLHVDPIGAGTYSGKLTLAVGGTTAVTLTVAHWWLIAGLVLLAGIALALFIQRCNGYWAPRARLFARLRDTAKKKDGAVTGLRNAAGTAPWKDFDLKDLSQLQDALRNEINAQTKWRAVFQIPQKVIDALDAKIDDLEKTIGMLGDLAGPAGALDAALETLSDKRPAGLPPLLGPDRQQTEPGLVPVARQLETGVPLSKDDLKTRGGELTAMVQTVSSLHADELELAHYWSQAAELQSGLPATMQDKVVALKKSLEAIRHTLWTGETAGELDVEDALKTAEKTIGDLWSSWPSPPELVSYDQVRTFFVEGLFPGLGGVAEAAAPPPPPLSAAEAKKAIRAAVLLQGGVIVASIAVAVVTGMTLLYVGKPWGTPWDYVSVLFWGLMSQAVITTVAGAFDGLGGLDALRFGAGAHPKPTATA